MKAKRLFLSILLYFIITFIIAALATLLWNLYIAKSGAIVKWRIALSLAFIISIVIPAIRMKDK